MGLSPYRVAGAGLLLATYLPLHRLLDPTRAGPAGLATREAAEAVWRAGLLGTLAVVGGAVALALITEGAGVRRLAAAAGRRVSRLPGSRVAAGLGVFAFAAATSAATLLFGRSPTSVDAMAQLLHARALAGGSLGLPLPDPAAAWLIQNGLQTPVGWVSIYPPGHTLALAAGLLVGGAWLVGPAAAGLAAALTALGLEEVLGRSARARAGALLVVVSPFFVLLGATHLSHATALAAGAGVFFSAAKGRSRDPAWAALTGALVGVFVCIRPLTGLAVSAGILVALRTPAGLRGAAALTAGGAPFAVALLAWNRRLFGDPLRLGYEAAFGPAHGLGLHPDPWGNRYGVAEALGYTGADLAQLGAHLLESPLPATALVGAWLLTARRVPRGTGVLLAWGGAALLANAGYWHHGVHFGPRMLYETVPAWCALWALSAAALLADGRPGRVGAVAGWVVVLSVAGSAVLTPAAVVGYHEGRAVAGPPATPPADGLILVHGSWASRTSARLAAEGMRRDSIETALRRNDLCSVSEYARWRGGGRDGPPPALEMEPLPGSPPGLGVVELSPGNPARLRPGALPASCAREAAADRFGTLDLEPLLWRWPPESGAPLVVARDLGPLENRATLAAFPDLRPRVWVGGRVLPYDEGMDLLWRGAARLSEDAR